MPPFSIFTLLRTRLPRLALVWCAVLALAAQAVPLDPDRGVRLLMAEHATGLSGHPAGKALIDETDSGGAPLCTLRSPAPNPERKDTLPSFDREPFGLSPATHSPRCTPALCARQASLPPPPQSPAHPAVYFALSPPACSLC